MRNTPLMSWEQACRRAGGRRGYNAQRQFQAAYRRSQLVRFMGPQTGKGPLGHYGWQAAAARALGVSRSTICRDAAALDALWREGQRCPLCGSHS